MKAKLVSCVLFAGLLLVPVGARAEDGPAAVVLPTTFEVRAVRDLAYYEGNDADKIKHKLDLFLPKDKKDFPVVFFVHGGAWMHGDKNFLGVYSALGSFFARHGIGAVITNYRLSPSVKHPEHVKDVARAFAWTVKNIAKHGGNPEQVFLCGHSAGAHLVSLLTVDESYLKVEGVPRAAIKGVMPISGVYAIPENLLPMVFGRDPQVRRKAGPITHVQAGLPPFLVLYAEKDFNQIDTMSQDFAKALQDKGCDAELREIKKRNHMSIIANACVDDDSVAMAMLAFVAKLTR